MPSRRQSILEVLVERVEAIRTVDGFATDGGANVFFGEKAELGPDDPRQAISIVPGIEEPQWAVQGKAYQVRLPVAFVALAYAEQDAPWMVIEELIGDLKRAIELEADVDRTLGGLLFFPFERGIVQALPREPGSTTVGAAVTYVMVWKEGFGNP